MLPAGTASVASIGTVMIASAVVGNTDYIRRTTDATQRVGVQLRPRRAAPDYLKILTISRRRRSAGTSTTAQSLLTRETVSQPMVSRKHRVGPLFDSAVSAF